MEIPFTGDEFDGINTYLFQKKKINMEYNVLAEAETYPGWGEPIFVIDPSNENRSNDWVCPNNQYLSNITFSYKFFAFNLTHYTIKTRISNDIKNFPLGWKLEGSVDKYSWIELHSISDTNDLEYVGAYHTYECKNSGYFSNFRLTMTQENSNEAWSFHVNRVEFFGSIVTTKNPFNLCTNKCIKRMSLIPIFVSSLFCLK